VEETMFKKLREPVSGLTHLGAAIAAAIGLIILLVIGWGNLGKTISLTIYGISLILLFTASAIYHMVKARPSILNNLRKLDHSAIYILIAGTYTPFCFNLFSGFWQWGMLILVWSLTFIGVAVKLLWINAPRWLYTGVYIAMGWLALLGGKDLLTTLPVGAIVWLLVGGITFTVGAVIYATKTFNFLPGIFGFHEVWHIFVIIGALAHFIGILVYIAPA
jgi:hemolysin III